MGRRRRKRRALADLHTAVFDKTGTLTVTRVAPYNGFSREELLSLAAHAEAPLFVYLGSNKERISRFLRDYAHV